MQLSSLASSALELQLLPLVLRNLITTTPNSTYMYIIENSSLQNSNYLVVHKKGRACQTKQFGRARERQLGLR